MKKVLSIGVYIYFICNVSLVQGTIIWDDSSAGVNHNPNVTVTYDTPVAADMTPYDSNSTHNQNAYEIGRAHV